MPAARTGCEALAKLFSIDTTQILVHSRVENWSRPLATYPPISGGHPEHPKRRSTHKGLVHGFKRSCNPSGLRLL